MTHKFATILVALTVCLFGTSVFAQGTSQEPQAPVEAGVETPATSVKPNVDDARDAAADAAIDAVKAKEAWIRKKAEELKSAEEMKKAEREQRRKEDKYARAAREQLEKEEKHKLELAKRLDRAEDQANVRGCDNASSGEVFVDPSIGNEYGLRTTTINSMYTFYITNHGPGTLDIASTRHGLLIGNLCSGGQVTLIFARRRSDPTTLQFNVVATERSGGSGTRTDSRSVSLYETNATNHISLSEVWGIQFR